MMYRRKNELIEAMQWDGEESTAREIRSWTGGVAWYHERYGLFLKEFDGTHPVHVGQYVVPDSDGTYYRLGEGEFNALYEPVPPQGDRIVTAIQAAVEDVPGVLKATAERSGEWTVSIQVWPNPEVGVLHETLARDVWDAANAERAAGTYLQIEMMDDDKNEGEEG